MLRQIIQCALVLSSLLFLSGCIPYLLPSFEMTPAVRVGESGTENVHVFRVDYCSKRGSPCYDDEWYHMRRLPLVAGTVLPQAKAGLDRGIIIIGVALNYHLHYHNGCHVRLYRPGFRLVEFTSWQLGKQIEWQPANSLADREEAIDGLIGNCGTVRDYATLSTGASKELPWALPGGLRNGSYSARHRNFLLFAACEYERLQQMGHPECTEEDRQRLLHKAKQLREHAVAR